MCNFSGMIKNVLPSLRQRAGPQRICSRQKSIRSGTARDSFSQTPHMRGKADSPSARFRIDGITPAHAGKRAGQHLAAAPQRDHPRTCGEKPGNVSGAHNVAGSPPHMRGKEKREVDENQPCGITPAHAGKRTGSLTAPQQIGDHPRTCGEKVLFCAGALLCQGSPPHMRGKVGEIAVDHWLPGITPAHAGKRRDDDRQCFTHWDHPRTCGEKLSISSAHISQTGSPPHMRGKV